MELKHYIFLLRKWAWLLILGAVVGGSIGYFVSVRQPKMYQSGTRVMVMRSPEERTSEYSTVWSDIQLAKTYTQLIATGPVLEALSEELGYPVKGAQIRVSQQPESFILDVTVRDGDPKKAAEIANSLVGVFINYNENLLNARFSSSEESLQAQIQQLETQINSLRQEMSQISAENLVIQKQKVEEEIGRLEPEINRLNREITAILPPTAIPRPGEEVIPVILSPEQQTALDDLRRQLDQVQKRYDLYNEIYLNLTVLGEPMDTSSQGVRQEQIQTTLNLYQQIYTNLLNNYENVRLARLRSTPNVVQIEPALVSTTPVQPQPVRSGVIGAAIGMMIGGLVAFLVEYLDDTIKTPEEIMRQLRIPVIGMIAEMETPRGEKPGVYVAEYPRSPITEAFRSLRTNLEFAAVDQPLKSILVTSANPSEGKSTIAINLAAVIAQGEKKVILVDADLRRPSVHRFFRIPNRIGLSEVFRHQLQLPNALVDWEGLPLKILPCGSIPPNPAELLGSKKMSEIIENLENMSDMVVIDCPPFIVADSISLAAKVDGVIVVIEPNGTQMDAARSMLETLNRSGVRVLGAVMNPIRRRGASYYSGRYRYYSDYYYSRTYGYLQPEQTRPRKNQKKKEISPPTQPVPLDKS
jgi:capsular exopolysaccharide synthesis family protein